MHGKGHIAVQRTQTPVMAFRGGHLSSECGWGRAVARIPMLDSEEVGVGLHALSYVSVLILIIVQPWPP